MYTSLIRYVLENYGVDVLWGPFAMYTKRVPPPIEHVYGRAVLESRIVWYDDNLMGYIPLPSHVLKILVRPVEKLDFVKPRLRAVPRKGNVVRVLVLIELLPPENDVDTLMKLAELYEEESRKYRELFRQTKLREVTEFGFERQRSRETVREIETLIDRL